MVTSIQITESLLLELKQRKMYNKESYEEVIWDLIEDNSDLSEITKKLVKKAELDFKKGRIYTHDQVKKELGL